ncbi:ester cyclase [Staphylococcus equorum]|uniref:ester cyclase n=1 Tax=Staphylococcus equorum TaxID=246432 RepID=UPI003AB022CD
MRGRRVYRNGKGSFDACPDFNLEAKVVFAEGNEIAVYLEFEGTHTAGEYFGVPATGKYVKNHL